jgi:hypothetical protein
MNGCATAWYLMIPTTCLRLLAAMLALSLGACATRSGSPADDGTFTSSTDVASTPAPAATQALPPLRSAYPVQDMLQWKHQTFPGKKPVDYRVAVQDGRPALHARADHAMSVLMQTLKPSLLPPGGVFSFSWWVPALNPKTNLAEREGDDSPVRVVLAFDGDKNRFTAKEALQDELLRMVTGQPKPYATLSYVWCASCAAETVIVNPRSSRMRKMVVQSGGQGLGQWHTHTRDVRADFEKAFGEPAGPLIGLGLMTDSDNTQTTSEAWYGDVLFKGLD